MPTVRSTTRRVPATVLPLTSAVPVAFGCGGAVTDVDPGRTPQGTGGATGPAEVDGGSAPGDGGSGGGGDSGGSGDGGSAAGGSGSGGSSCGGGLTQCDGECVNTNTSSLHCGACWNICPLEAACFDGSCQFIFNARPCKPNETVCRMLGCVDLETNAYACGNCDTPCPGNTACVGGKCDPEQCMADLEYCEANGEPSPSPAGCTSLQTDSANCGRCGHACDALTERCSEGRCVWNCADAEVRCPDHGCVDLARDAEHCGECGNDCYASTPFTGASIACVEGECDCARGAVSCGAACARTTFYCPLYTGPEPLELCRALADSPFERCACDSCFDLLAECTGDARCVNAVDCFFENSCPSCSPPFLYNCTDQDGATHPLATEIFQCLSSRCGG